MTLTKAKDQKILLKNIPNEIINKYFKIYYI